MFFVVVVIVVVVVFVVVVAVFVVNVVVAVVVVVVVVGVDYRFQIDLTVNQVYILISEFDNKNDYFHRTCKVASETSMPSILPLPYALSNN